MQSVLIVLSSDVLKTGWPEVVHFSERTMGGRIR